MLKLSIKPQWLLHKAGTSQPLSRLLELLRAVEEERSITGAAVRLDVSYRHAWGMIRRASREFGAPLVDMSRGRRAALTALAQRLVAADRRIDARIAPLLDSLASEVEAQIERARIGERAVLTIHASHGYAIELLRTFLTRRNTSIELRYRGSMEALASLAGGSCELAGFHAPTGDLEGAVLAFYAQWLDPVRQRLVQLCTRRQGIMTAAGNPKAIQALADLATPGVRFVNRQFGSGTRILLELLLERDGLDGTQIAGYGTGEFTHSGVAACIASGLADAGFGVETAARQFNLDFIPLVSERYFLACDEQALETPIVKRIREIVLSKQFRAEAGALAGVDVMQAGGILTLKQAFPGFSFGAARRSPAPEKR